MKTELVEGRRGEFSVWIDGRKVAKKRWLLLPSEAKVLAAVKQALG